MRIFSWNRNERYALAFGLLVAVVLCLLRLSGSEETGDSCVSEACHETVYNEGTSNPFVHTPFAEAQCEKCHLEATVASLASTDVRDPSSKILTHPIVLSQPDYQTEHTVLLRGLMPQAVYDIYVTLQDASDNLVKKEFRRTVPAQVRDVRTNDRTEPQVFDVRVGPVTKRVFLETTVNWKTDEPATSLVEYGLTDRYGQYTSEDNVLVKNHSKNIYELQGSKDYHFRVISRDIYGNEGVSKDLQFSTGDDALGLAARPAETDGEGDEKSLVLDRGEVFLMQSDIGVYMETSKPTRVTVEYVKLEETASDLVAKSEVLADSEDSHEVLREGKDLAIDACYQCHSAEDLGVSHPVGMEPSGKTTIPDDLPTLEGGVLTCNTCHETHGGIRRYFARKEVTKDICISCHEGY